jgi:hypothetical protein
MAHSANLRSVAAESSAVDCGVSPGGRPVMAASPEFGGARCARQTISRQGSLSGRQSGVAAMEGPVRVRMLGSGCVGSRARPAFRTRRPRMRLAHMASSVSAGTISAVPSRRTVFTCERASERPFVPQRRKALALWMTSKGQPLLARDGESHLAGALRTRQDSGDFSRLQPLNRIARLNRVE